MLNLGTSKNHKIKAVLFDMDNTLSDTRQIFLSALQKMLDDFVGIAPEYEQLLDMYGTPTSVVLARFAPPETVALMLRAWPDYLNQCREQFRLYPGVLEMLGIFQKAGLRMGIVTSQNEVENIFMRALAGLDAYIDIWVTAEKAPRPKPYPDPILLALKKLGVEPAQAVMVGDSFNDLEAGKRAGTHIGAALWGAAFPQKLLAFRPHFVFRQVKDLRVLLN
jgi:pyrophosphatase PpaX